MTWRPLDRGPLSDLAANYLDTTAAWSDHILTAETERRRAVNDIIAAMLAIKRAGSERRTFTS